MTTYAVVAICRSLDEARPMLAAARPYASRATVVVNGSGLPTVEPTFTAHYRPFVNFGQQRSEAFRLARGTADWLLALDADMTVEIDPDFEPDPSVDCYLLEMGNGALSWRLPLLLRGDLLWRSIGAVHEYTSLPDRAYVGVPTDAVCVRHPGAAADELKLRWHAGLLEQSLLTQPEDPRSVFYLAQTYRDLGDPRAIDLYEHRIGMAGGFEEERYIAAYALAALEPDWPRKLVALIRAWELRPTRLEALYDAVHGLNNRGQHNTAWALSSVPIQPSNDVLFVWPNVWTWGLSYERWRAATALGLADQQRRIAMQLRDTAPMHIRHELQEAA